VTGKDGGKKDDPKGMGLRKALWRIQWRKEHDIRKKGGGVQWIRGSNGLNTPAIGPKKTGNEQAYIAAEADY